MVFRVLRAATVWSDGSPMGPEHQTENTKSHRPLFFHSSSAFTETFFKLPFWARKAQPAQKEKAEVARKGQAFHWSFYISARRFPSQASEAGGISVAHSASCGFGKEEREARVAGDIKFVVTGIDRKRNTAPRHLLCLCRPRSRACCIHPVNPQLALWATDMSPATRRLASVKRTPWKREAFPHEEAAEPQGHPDRAPLKGYPATFWTYVQPPCIPSGTGPKNKQRFLLTFAPGPAYT
jgi:hypothetical protein